ncbi:MAG: hypothetical protein MUC50_03190 [Myxococcota bacterium]|nr:hypothetical protein [Myxococcota bacterium]
MFRKNSHVLSLGLMIVLFSSASAGAEDVVQTTLPPVSTPTAEPAQTDQPIVSAPAADSSGSLPENGAIGDSHNAAPPQPSSAAFEVTHLSYDAKLADKAKLGANAGFIIAPAVLLFSSLPYLAFLEDPYPDSGGGIGISERTLNYTPVIVPLVSVAALANLIASSVVIVRGSRARNYYGVPGNRKARVFGITLFVLSYLPMLAGPFGIEWFLPPVCGLLGVVGLMSLALDNLDTARQAEGKIKGEGRALERERKVTFAPMLSPVPTKDGVTGLTVGLQGAF